MVMYNKILFFVFLCIIISGCLTDNISPPLVVETESSAELLHYFEEQGDYINSTEIPSLIEASEVYAQLNNYLIIDVRSGENFGNGHIETAVNISNTELLNYVLTNSGNYPKVVIVSSNGQASAYYTCLLRLYGLNNVYSMNFGMAYWNIAFAGEWLQKINNSPLLSDYNNINYPKGPFTALPEINEHNGNISDNAKQRIASLITRGFIDTIDDVEETIIGSTMYFVCYGSFDLYYDPERDGPGHPPNTIFYRETIDLRSINFLQTLPTDKEILIYDYSGQLSAAVTAYLRVLGYDANSFLFGACQFFYNRMLFYMDSYAFMPERVNDYPYIEGE